MLNIIAIGYYNEGVFNYCEDFTGFEDPCLKFIENLDSIILRYSIDDNNECYREREITRKEAEFLLSLKN